MSHADDVFYRQFGAILVLLIIFALIAGFLANAIGGDALARISQSPSALIERIQPVGSVATKEATAKTEDMSVPAPVATAPVTPPANAPAVAASAERVTAAPAVVAAAPAAAVPAAAATQPAASTATASAAPATAAAPAEDEALGRTTYTTACLACHQIGVANAPKFGDTAEWSKRAEQGLEALYTAGIKGKGQLMPAKGGNPTLSDDAVKAAVRYLLRTADVDAG